MRPLSIPGLPRFSGSTTLAAHTLGANLKRKHINTGIYGIYVERLLNKSRAFLRNLRMLELWDG